MVQALDRVVVISADRADGEDGRGLPRRWGWRRPAVAATPRGTSAAAVITVVSATARFLPRWCRTTLMASILWRGRHHSGGGGRPGAHTGSGEDQESSDPPHSQYE